MWNCKILEEVQRRVDRGTEVVSEVASEGDLEKGPEGGVCDGGEGGLGL